MPIQRFRSGIDMHRPLWRRPGDPDLYASIRALWSFGDRVQQRRFPPGVHKHRSIDALDARVQDWHRAHVAAKSSSRAAAALLRRDGVNRD